MGYRSSRGRYREKSAGQLAAEKHIAEAEALSAELGGTDKDVKAYFFSLTSTQLNQIFAEYGRRYGDSAREYAERTLPDWRSGVRSMSGLVAGRLFSFLPSRMPLDAKYRLVESLWKHSGASSHATIYCGKQATAEEIRAAVSEMLNAVVSEHHIPEGLERRFNWLSEGDAHVKQQLLNYFRQLEKKLVDEALQQRLTILIDSMSGRSGSVHHGATERITIGKHILEIRWINSDTHISYMAPVTPTTPDKTIFDYWWVFVLIFILFLMIKK